MERLQYFFWNNVRYWSFLTTSGLLPVHFRSEEVISCSCSLFLMGLLLLALRSLMMYNCKALVCRSMKLKVVVTGPEDILIICHPKKCVVWSKERKDKRGAERQDLVTTYLCHHRISSSHKFWSSRSSRRQRHMFSY